MFEKIKKLIKKRRVQSVLIILIGIVVSFSIVQGTNGESPEKENSSDQGKIIDSSTLAYENKERSFASEEENSSDGNVEDKNLTNYLADKYVENIKEENPDGLREVDGQEVFNAPSLDSLNSDDFNFSEEAESAFNFNLFKEEDIKISQNNSEKAQLNYLNEVNNLSQKNFENINFSEIEMLRNWMNTRQLEQLKAYKNSLSTQINDLLETKVPPSWSEFHLNLLNLTKKKTETYSFLINHNEDPLKSVMAFRKASEFIQEAESLQTNAQERMVNLKNKQ